MLNAGFTEVSGTDDILARISAHAIVNEINNILKGSKPYDWASFDPFGIWKEADML
ncbi:MAG: hypothetical protein K2F97_08620 [Muribaculaceae bacterium]|nr:hypothetical protein [Muribaculaceae bacterium]